MDKEQVTATIAKFRKRGKHNKQIILPSPARPMEVAREFVDSAFTHAEGRTLCHWRGGWWKWRGSYWEETDERALRALLYVFTEHAVYLHDKENEQAWAPNRKRISDLADALSAICILPTSLDQPCWLDGRDSGPIVATANGLLDVERQRLTAHSPLFFNQTAVQFNYDPDAPAPARWLEFLGELWPQEPQAIDALGEWFGYVISGRMDLHKILLMVGPTRGGKGVIARIETALIGKQNVAGPTLNSLSGEFGLAPLIGKPLAIISDARFVGKHGGIVVERLLSISGEDALTINRKYRDQWTGKLPCRLHIASNELPRLGDASAAIVGRLVVLILLRSWLGRENYDLETTLRQELAGILNWALDGLRRLTLQNNNVFTRAPSADEAIVQMRDLASPVGAFVREKCKLDAEKEVDVDVLYATYKSWADDNGYPKITKQTLGRDLRAAVPSIRIERPRRHDGIRVRRYVGIRLKTPDDDKNESRGRDEASVSSAWQGEFERF
jgi:putative DNA primase/helicase